jgi:hypothetical protein
MRAGIVDLAVSLAVGALPVFARYGDDEVARLGRELHWTREAVRVA